MVKRTPKRSGHVMSISVCEKTLNVKNVQTLEISINDFAQRT